MFDVQIPQNFGDVLVVLSKNADVGGQTDIPHGDIFIKIEQNDKTLVTTNISDNDGQFEYRLVWGEYQVVASFKDENDQQWNCWGTIKLDSTQETLVVPCYDRQYNFMPYTTR